jgi:5-methyltetrahydropteroyltriglutamate--homocysteine methyltransferase
MIDPAPPMPLFRAEVIGSLLRPRALKDAAMRVQAGDAPAADYDAVLEREIARVIALQEDLGFRAVTDGELARTSWFGFFFERMDGFRLAPSHFKFKDAHGHTFEWPTSVAEKPIRRRGPITLREYERASALTRTSIVKETMPTPSAFHFFRLDGSVDPSAYPDMSAYFDDLVAVYRAEIAELGRAGCRYVQFDEVPVAMMCDADVCRQAAAAGGDPTRLMDTYISLMQRIVADRPATMTIGMHLCRGNFRGRWMATGGYEPVAEKLFNHMPVDAFFLEYDSARAGDFQPLRFVPKGKRVVLGLVSSKTAELEDQSELLRGIDEAARIVPLEQLALSTQCGFASVAGGNTLSEDEQWAKLRLVAGTAERVWGRA